jgi:NADH dehydrogenase (ubiquinone) 1 alpha subcomplex subunit 5
MFLRRFVGPLLSSVKESTGLVGLDVVPNAREVLIGLYNETLKVVKDQIPERAEYRRSVEQITNYRLKVCQEEEEHERIEQRIGCGQVEELIEQAKDELELIPQLAGEPHC